MDAEEEAVATGDEVRLAVPATPEFLRLARLAASGLASRMGFSYDEVDDLRLAVDELCFALIGGKGRQGSVLLRYAIVDGALEVEGTGSFGSADPDPVLPELSSQILTALVDEHQVFRDGDGSPGFRLLKRRAGGS